MFSKRVFAGIALAVIGLGIWYATQSFEYEYSRRALEDGSYRISSVMCGEPIPIIFFETYDDSVPGPATSADCTRLARTRLAEGVGIALLGLLAGYVGVRYGTQAAAPIDTELPRLPDGADRSVQGRIRRTDR